MQVHVQYLYITMLLVSYVPLTELQLKICTHMEVLYYCIHAQLVRYRSEHNCLPAIYYQVDSVTKALHSKDYYATNLKLDHTLLDAGDFILLYNLLKSYIGMFTGK